MNNALEIAHRLARIMVWISGSAVLFAALYVTADVLTRYITGASIGGADEISGYIVAVGVTWAMPYCVLERTNVRIDAVYGLLSERMQAALDILCVLSMGIFGGVLAWRAWLVFLDSVELDSHSITPLQTPLALPQGIWFAGIAVFILVLVLVFAKCLSSFARGDFAAVTKLAGARTVTEETLEEMHALEDGHGPSDGMHEKGRAV